MPKIVGILTFISRINTTSESFNGGKYYFKLLNFMSSGNFIVTRVEHEKSFITSGPDANHIRTISTSAMYKNIPPTTAKIQRLDS